MYGLPTRNDLQEIELSMAKTPRQAAASAARKKKQDAIIASCEQGATLSAACRAVNVSRRTLYRWFDKYPKFSRTVRESERAAVQVIYDAMWYAAKGHRYAECKVTLDDVYENGFPKKGPHGKRLVKRTRVRVGKEVMPNVAAADLWLRNHDKSYVQRQPEMAVGLDMDELKRTLTENASAYPEQEGKEGTDGNAG